MYIYIYINGSPGRIAYRVSVSRIGVSRIACVSRIAYRARIAYHGVSRIMAYRRIVVRLVFHERSATSCFAAASYPHCFSFWWGYETAAKGLVGY